LVNRSGRADCHAGRILALVTGDRYVNTNLLQLHDTNPGPSRVNDTEMFEGTAGFTGSASSTFVHVKGKYFVVVHFSLLSRSKPQTLGTDVLNPHLVPSINDASISQYIDSAADLQGMFDVLFYHEDGCLELFVDLLDRLEDLIHIQRGKASGGLIN